MSTPMSRRGHPFYALRVALVTALAVAAGITPGTAAPLLSDLIAWWPGEGNANDVVGLNTGTLNGGATASAPGRRGNAFFFDGVDDEVNVLKSTAAPSLNLLASDFSIEAWVKVEPNAPTRPGGYSIFLNYAGVPYYALLVTAEFKARAYFRPSVPSLSGNGNEPIVDAIGTTALNNGNWHHLVAVRSGASAILYVDGALDASVTNPAILSAAANYGSIDTRGCKYVRIGAIHSGRGHCNSPTANPAESHFPGLIDEVRVFKRALSQAEVQTLWNWSRAP